jgi:hypothetical protein
MPAVRLSARALLTALRLFRPGSVALGMTAHAEVAGSWHQVAMPFSGRAREDAWELRSDDDEELRQFVNAVRRVERRTRIAWALKRFEMGLERSVPAEGLTDYMLALRALLEASDDRGTAALPARVSALCAQDYERIAVREEVEAALALERLAVDGHVGRADRKRLGKASPLEVIAGTERHLRALLHDLVCGYLSTDLKSLADEILTADGEPSGDEIPVEDPVYLEPVPAPGAEPAPDPLATMEFEVVFDDAAEISATDARMAETEALEDDNVWTLRPAEEVMPAPEVSYEEPTPQMHALADDLVAGYDDALAGTMEDEAVVPEWDPTPERKPVGDHRKTVHDPIGPEAATGFTFDFKKIDTPPAPEAPRVVEPAMSEADARPDEAFPIPEFGVPTGRGPAAQRSDLEVEDGTQRQSFREIMDENFTPPTRDIDEPVTTPVGRDGKPHLIALDPVDEPVAPRIVHPDVFGTAPEVSQPLHPVDPNLTVEYDVLGVEPSAEEAAQLAWSQQFLNRPQEIYEEQEPVQEFEPELPEPRLLPPIQPVPDLVLTQFPESTEEVKPADHDHDRNLKIGPATIEFRPVVDPDADDPDDFSGAV